MKKVAVIGASGMLGKSLVATLSDNYELIGTYNNNPIPGLKQLDYTSPDSYTSFLNEIKPDVVVHAAALTDLERCEINPEEAWQLNVKPLEILAEWTIQAHSRSVFISTDGVFDGIRGNYCEDEVTNPINVYGATKLKAETIIKVVPYCLILRTAVLYSTNIKAKKFVGNTIGKLKQGQKVKGATNLIRSPTLTEDIALALQNLIDKDAEGIYHVAGSTSLSMYAAAKKIAHVFGYDQNLVEPILSKDLPSIVERPRDCSLVCVKLSKQGIKMRSFEDGLLYVKEFL